MSSFNDLFPSANGKPKRVTTLTSGAGSFVPLVAMGRYSLVVQAGGAGSSGVGGAAGACVLVEGIFVTTAAINYIVGAAGVPGVAGGYSQFGQFYAAPPAAPGSSPSQGGRTIATLGIDGGDSGGKGPGNIPLTASVYDGGSSVMGRGGISGGATASGYGAGGAPVTNGGADRNGTGGVIIVVEWGGLV